MGSLLPSCQHRFCSIYPAGRGSSNPSFLPSGVILNYQLSTIRHALFTNNHFFATFFFKLFAISKKQFTFAALYETRTTNEIKELYDEPICLYQPGSPAYYSRRRDYPESVRKVCVCTSVRSDR